MYSPLFHPYHRKGVINNRGKQPLLSAHANSIGDDVAKNVPYIIKKKNNLTMELIEQ